MSPSISWRRHGRITATARDFGLVVIQCALTRLMRIYLLASSPNKFSWYLIFADRNFSCRLVGWFVLEIRRRLRIGDAGSSSNFYHKFHDRFVTMEKPSAKLQFQLFQELAMWSETYPWHLDCKYTVGECYKNALRGRVVDNKKSIHRCIYWLIAYQSSPH